MKKFSVIFVAMLIALMLFVGCENKPKERAATTEEARLVNIFIGVAWDAVEDVVNEVALKGKLDPKKFPGLSLIDEKTIAFDEYKYTNYYGNRFVLCGTATYTENSACLDLTKGTKFNGTGHTLYVFYNKDTQEFILDGVILTDLILAF